MHIVWWILAGLIFLAALGSEGTSRQPAQFGAAAMFAILGYLHYLSLLIVANRKDADAVPENALESEMLTQIVTELKWQREQKEKEIIRAKAAAARARDL